MKVTKKTAGIAAIVGACVFTTTSLAVYNTGNGYDNLKNAILGTKNYTNCTIGATALFAIDGNDYSGTMLYEFDGENAQSYLVTESSLGNKSEEYHNNGAYYLRRSPDKNFTLYGETIFEKNLWNIGSEDEEEINKILKFMEIGLDTVVGDLKSNIVCTENTDEYTSYSLNLDYMQIPELVQAGLGVIGTSVNAYDTDTHTGEEANMDNAVYLLGKDPVVNNFGMDYRINKDGTLRDGEMRIELTGVDKNGESHTAEFVLTIEFSDIGTTVVTPVDVSNAQRLSWDISDTADTAMEE